MHKISWHSESTCSGVGTNFDLTAIIFKKDVVFTFHSYTESKKYMNWTGYHWFGVFGNRCLPK